MHDFSKISELPYHPGVEEIVDILTIKTSNPQRGFFRTMVLFSLAKMASTMRATVKTKERGDIPVNMYVIALATSGYGKGHSLGILENQITSGFRDKFKDELFVNNAETAIKARATAMVAASNRGLERSLVIKQLKEEFDKAGNFLYEFSAATPEAVKQYRNKLILADIGSLNLEIDEIGSNLLNSNDVLNLFLELADMGMTKEKLIKNSSDNARSSFKIGQTPTNALLFGTPDKVFDGAYVEEKFLSFLGIGYGRRCFFSSAIVKVEDKVYEDPSIIYDNLVSTALVTGVDKWYNRFSALACKAMLNFSMDLNRDEGIYLIAYNQHCAKRSDKFNEFDQLRRAEMGNRYFHVLKLAGILAFIERSNVITINHLNYAIRYVEDSGEAFDKIMTRDTPYVRLAKYIASCDKQLTLTELNEALPYVPKAANARAEMINNAVSYGSRSGIIIKRKLSGGVEIVSGQYLQSVNNEKLQIYASSHNTYKFAGHTKSISQIANWMVKAKYKDGRAFPKYSWMVHECEDGHRHSKNIIQGFENVVIDCDAGAKIDVVMEALNEQGVNYILHTTKRHTKDAHRFRLILPMDFAQNLDAEDYRDFMNNVMDWLPFSSDKGANQAARAWETNPGGAAWFKNDGDNLDSRLFIPDTIHNAEYMAKFEPFKSLTNLERWFVIRTTKGDRNNNMIKYALALYSNGVTYDDIKKSVLALNKQLKDKLPVKEIEDTILASMQSKIKNGNKK
jgi:hypothetical protein